MAGLAGIDVLEVGLQVEGRHDPFTGGFSCDVHLPLTTGRAGLTPSLSLRHSSHQNSPFGVGWSLAGVPSVAIDGRHSAPKYDGRERYLFEGEAELAPLFQPGTTIPWVIQRGPIEISFFRKRVGGRDLRLERWRDTGSRAVHWRSRDARNRVTFYGSKTTSRIADPDDASRCSVWLADRIVDSHGNAIEFEYSSENEAGLDATASSERGRLGKAQAQRYLKRVRYGNANSLGADAASPPPSEWAYEVVLDYGEHLATSRVTPDTAWPMRPDAFSSYRSGFEVRTRRLCRRVLLFHRFPSLGSEPALVQEVALTHLLDPTGARLEAVTLTGHRVDGPSRSAPPVRFSWATAAPATSFVEAPASALANAPSGLNARVRLVDLAGDGLQGLLTETDDAWYYKPNQGNGEFAEQAVVLERPSASAAFSIGDSDHDGNPDVASWSGRLAGKWALDRETGRWGPFKPIAAMAHHEGHPDAQWLDLNADGRPDLVFAQTDSFIWYPSREDGFDEPVQIPRPTGAGALPLLSERPAQRYFFADMTGDGLLDLVRVSNGRVEYWPHLGNGRFGDAVVMDDAPLFDDDDTFDPQRLRLVSLTGDSRTGLVYIGRNETRLFANASGNRLVALSAVRGPTADALTSARVCDFLGTGQQCLVLSSTRPDACHPVVFLALTAPIAPGTLLAFEDGMGLRTELEWGSSASHYLRAQSAEPWRTRLPSHVAVVDALTSVDLVTGARSVSRYTYADGALDARRGVIGFGRVDERDASIPVPGEERFSPPLLTRAWFHQGRPMWGQHPSASYQLDALAPRLEPHEFIDGAVLSNEDFEDALALLAGTRFRQERFTVLPDGSIAIHPLSITMTRQRVERVQPRQGLVGACWSLTSGDDFELTYEGAAGDPRVSHTCVLALDDSELPRSTAEIHYPRRSGRPVDVAAQARLSIVVSRQERVLVQTPDLHLLGVPVSHESVELHALPLAGNAYLSRAVFETTSVRAALQTPMLHHEVPPAGQLAARLLERGAQFYWNDAGTAPLPSGSVGHAALPHHEESACFAPAAITAALGARLSAQQLSSLGYVLRDGLWWAPGETRKWTPFGQLARTERGDGAVTAYRYDTGELALLEVTTAAGSTVSTIDYHQVAPTAVTDPNGVRTEVRFDALGVAIAGSQRGQLRDPAGTLHRWGDGDVATWSPPAGDGVAAALANASTSLGDASWARFYDLTGPASGAPLRRVSTQRTARLHDGLGGPSPAAEPEVSIEYVDGFGRSLQRKSRVEGGPAISRDAQGRLSLDVTGAPLSTQVPVRWLASGFAHFDQKQSVGRLSEPFFSATPAFEDDAALRNLGAATLHAFDALGRPTGLVTAEGTQARTQYGPWEVREWDANDLVAGSTWEALRSSLPASHPDRLALAQARAHSDTPSSRYLGPDGQTVARLERGTSPAEDRTSSWDIDASGSTRAIHGPRGFRLFEHLTDMEGQRLRTRSVDAGESFAFEDAWGRVVHTWDARGTHEERSFDRLDRVTAISVGGQTLEQFTWGDEAPIVVGTNTAGRVARQRDQSGELRVEAYWPDGSPARSERQLCSRWDVTIDWSTGPALDPERFRTEAFFDALGRPTRQRLPDGTERTWQYAIGGQLLGQRIATLDGTFSQQVTTLLDSDARGRRRGVRFGAVDVASDFDPLSQRLRSVRARRGPDTLQDLRFTFDPVGNVTQVDDAAQRPGVLSSPLKGLTATAEQDFTYDAHYRLLSASGRVHQSLLARDDLPGSTSGVRNSRHLSLNNGMAVERYTRTYRYDRGGNLEQLSHAGASSSWGTSWWISPGSNRALPDRDAAGQLLVNPETYFDGSGLMTRLGHVGRLEWDYRRRVRRAVVIDRSARGLPDDEEVYVHGSDGLRVRTLTARLKSGNEVELTERIVLDGCELKRIRRSAGVVLERWTSQLSEGGERIAQLHRWTRDDHQREVDSPRQLRFVYSLTNHVGSALLSFDEAGRVASYEEYFPYGGSAFIAGDSLRQVELRQWRFSGKQRDDLTGLYDFGHRLYSPWLCRWLSPDPIGPEDSLNLYEFARGNPTTLRDRDGLSTDYHKIGEVPLELKGKPITASQAVRFVNRRIGLLMGFQVTRLEKRAVEGDPNGAWFIPPDAVRRLNPEIAQMAQRDLKKAQQLMDALTDAGLDPTSAFEGDGAAAPKPQKNADGEIDGKQTQEGGDVGGASQASKDGGAAASAGLTGASSAQTSSSQTETTRGTGDQGDGGGPKGAAGKELADETPPEETTAGQGTDAVGGGTAEGRDRDDREGTTSGTGTQTGGTSQLPACDEGKQVAPPGLQQNGDDVNGSTTGSPQGVRGDAGAQAQRKRSGRGDYSGARGGPGSHPGAGGAGSGGGSGTGDATALDKITKVAGWTQLEFSSPAEGVSGGIPGGRGSMTSRWAQALYVLVAVISVVGLVRSLAKKAIQRLLRAIWGRPQQLSIFSRAASVALRPFFEWVGRMSLAEAKQGVKLALSIRLRRFFATPVAHVQVGKTPIGAWLKKLPGLAWEQGHTFLQQRWFRPGGPTQWYPTNALAQQGMERIGNAGWNLIAQPDFLNAALNKSSFLATLFGIGSAAAVPAAGYGGYKLGETIMGEGEDK